MDERAALIRPGEAIEIVAPSRLHFGMLSFGQPGVRQFGGVGAMLHAPAIRLEIQNSERFEVRGPHSARVRAVAARVVESLGVKGEPACAIEVAAPQEHVGLGTGTQLSLAVATGLLAFLGHDSPPIAELACLAGRGARSAIGSYGFYLGGLLVDGGKESDEPLSPLLARACFPASWRFVLLTPRGERGLSGTAERDAFAGLPPVPLEVTDRLCRLVTQGLLPAAAEERFDEFSEHLFDFGALSGGCFAARQGGPFNGPRLTRLVELVRGLGVRGVGQSSWGPTLYALLPSEADAAQFVERLRGQPEAVDVDFTITFAQNYGAEMFVTEARRPG